VRRTALATVVELHHHGGREREEGAPPWCERGGAPAWWEGEGGGDRSVCERERRGAADGLMEREEGE